MEMIFERIFYKNLLGKLEFIVNCMDEITQVFFLLNI